MVQAGKINFKENYQTFSKRRLILSKNPDHRFVGQFLYLDFRTKTKKAHS